MAKDDEKNNIEDQVINEEKRTTTRTEKVVEHTVDSKAHQFTDVELVLVVLVALVAGMIIAALIKKLLDGRRESPGPWPYPPMPPFAYHLPPPGHRRTHTRMAAMPSEEEFQKQAAIERTPPSFLKHGIYLDSDGEAVYDPDFSVYETWQVMRDARHRIIDAVRLEE
jgi:hypothetical protein